MSENKLIGHNSYLENFVSLYKYDKLPSKILISGKKGIGKSLLINNFLLKIFNSNNDHELITNMTHPNILNIKKTNDKKNIEIDQIREVVKFTNQSSFNNKARFIIIDDAEFLNINSSNALLKNLEEPNENVFFILIFNSDFSLLDTIKSRCIEFKINISNENIELIVNNYFKNNIYSKINSDLINYYSTPLFLISLLNYMNENELSISKTSIDDLLINLINNKHYNKQDFIRDNLNTIIELFFYNHINKTKKLTYKIKEYYYLKFSNVRKFNLDYETFFLEFKDKLLSE
ncbi:AAA family ATPase [Candidatus Pelagibacter sp.]|nr:AAA family ATPase [Candidatus Pelagibacter sp.]